MTELELLGVGRAVLAVIVVVFALRARYWFLATAGVFGIGVSIMVAMGYQPIWTGRLAYGLYAAIAAHALDVTRRVHPSRRKPV